MAAVDTSIIPEAKKDHQPTFSELYHRTHNRVYYTALSILKNDQDALDVVQDTYIQAFQKLDSLQDETAFEGWISRICANRCKDILRKKSPLLFQTKEQENFVVDSIEEIDEFFLPQSYIDNQIKRSQVIEMIDSLSDMQRTAILLYYYDEIPVKEIARIMEVGEATVYSRLLYAKKAIKQQVLKLEKSGDKLYGLAPAPVLSVILRYASQSHVLPEQIANDLFINISAASGTAMGASQAVSGGNGVFAKISALSTTAKVAIAGVTVTLVIVGAAIPIALNSAPKDYVIEQPESVIERREPVIEQQEPVIEQQEPVIEWKEPVIEQLTRNALENPTGDIMSSDLDEVTYIVLLGDDYLLINPHRNPEYIGHAIGGYYNNTFAYYTDPFSQNVIYTEKGTISNIEDFRYFKNLSRLQIVANDISDLTTLVNVSSLNKLELAYNSIPQEQLDLFSKQMPDVELIILYD